MSRSFIGSNYVVVKLQVTSSKESLLKHCFNHETLASAGIGDYMCLRLNKLSLTRMGSIEKLLWVQMLDLSHNEIRSIEGTFLCSNSQILYFNVAAFTCLYPNCLYFPWIHIESFRYTGFQFVWFSSCGSHIASFSTTLCFRLFSAGNMMRSISEITNLILENIWTTEFRKWTKLDS